MLALHSPVQTLTVPDLQVVVASEAPLEAALGATLQADQDKVFLVCQVEQEALREQAQGQQEQVSELA